MTIAGHILIAIATTIAMEGVAGGSHKYIMHSWGWGWHRSHHENKSGGIEENDLYAIVFASISIGLMIIGQFGAAWLCSIGIGMMIYGMLYFIVHDGLIHRRWPVPWLPRTGYAKRLIQAHRLHHATAGRDYAVSFGFLYAPPLEQLRRQYKSYARLHANPKPTLDVKTVPAEENTPSQ